MIGMLGVLGRVLVGRLPRSVQRDLLIRAGDELGSVDAARDRERGGIRRRGVPAGEDEPVALRDRQAGVQHALRLQHRRVGDAVAGEADRARVRVVGRLEQLLRRGQRSRVRSRGGVRRWSSRSGRWRRIRCRRASPRAPTRCVTTIATSTSAEMKAARRRRRRTRAETRCVRAPLRVESVTVLNPQRLVALRSSDDAPHRTWYGRLPAEPLDPRAADRYAEAHDNACAHRGRSRPRGTGRRGRRRRRRARRQLGEQPARRARRVRSRASSRSRSPPDRVDELRAALSRLGWTADRGGARERGVDGGCRGPAPVRVPGARQRSSRHRAGDLLDAQRARPQHRADVERDLRRGDGGRPAVRGDDRRAGAGIRRRRCGAVGARGSSRPRSRWTSRSRV